MVSGATLVNRMGTMALPFLVLYLTQHLGYSPKSAGLVMTAYGVGGLVSSPLAGWLCDRVGALRVMSTALFLSGVLYLLYPLLHEPEAVLALTVLLAVVAEAVRPASLVALTGAIAPEQRKAAIALNRLAVNLGMSVGPAVGGFLATASFPLLFMVDGTTSLLAGSILAATLWRTGPRAQAADAATIVAEAVLAPPLSAGVLRDGRMLVYLTGVFLIAVVFLQHEAALPLFLVRDLGLRESFYGLTFAVNTLLIVLLEVPLNLAMAHWPYRRALVLGALLVAAGFGGMALVAGPWGVMATVLIWTFGEMIFFPTSATYVADMAPPARRGAYMGAYTMS
ncbi:MAG TPA: MFS transporter, partial [Longimicrobiaceae bacterium]|nr:MFS transporter [Longimicrobiaceae bacterium]